jgi:hypothetical protein
MIKELFLRNQILFWLGAAHFGIFLLLFFYYPFNEKVVLGINSVIKPMKFALSIGVYSWTMALILYYVKDVSKVAVYSWVAVVCMGFEQLAITAQALRGELSHFNKVGYGAIVFALMGIFILTVTLWTAYITYIFFKQANYDLPPAMVLSIKLGLIYFVVFSLFGGYIVRLQGHTIGATDGGEGIWFLNWSRFFGDLRVAHFFGMHSLQILPLFALLLTRFPMNTSPFNVTLVWVFSIMYLIFVMGTLAQGLMKVPFFR